MAAKKKVSGPSGKNKQRGFNLHEKTPGQLEEWRDAAQAARKTLSNWIREACEEKLQRER
jgi:hypothetical protein